MTDQRVTCELCAPPASAARPRVLVIDDEEAIRFALSRALAAEGLVIDLAETAADGLSRARAEVYDLVILDLLMPGKGQLLESVWGYDFDPGSNIVGVCVSRLRSKIGDHLITTVRGEGYRLAAG
jgi:DNA-binding response OmpR family regulator